MANRRTGISWATLGLTEGATSNPIRAVNKETGDEGHYCERKNGRCRQCYASWFNEKRFRGLVGTGLAFERPNRAKVEIIWKEHHAAQVWGWQKPTGVFWADMTDLNGDWNPEWMRYRMFTYAMLATQHRHAFLTKRPEVYLSMINDHYGSKLKDELQQIAETAGSNAKRLKVYQSIFKIADTGADLFQQDTILWGVTIGHQEDIDKLAATMKELKRLKPNMRLWVSYEPAHGLVDWTPLKGVIEWLVAGGESRQEPNKPLVEYLPEWGTAAREWCEANGVAFYHKQMGTIWTEKHHSQSPKADIMAEWPTVLQVHQFPSFEVNP